MVNNDFLLNELEMVYPRINEAAKTLNENDLKSYIDFCKNCPTNCPKDLNTWKVYTELKKKCFKNGLDSIIFRKDVINLSKCHFDGGRDYPSYDYITVQTKYGSFSYLKK